MPYSKRERLGVWLEKYSWTHPFLLKYTHEFAGHQFYVNRLSRFMKRK